MCNSPSHRAQSAAREMRHTAELMNRPPADQPPRKSLCTCSRRSASLSQGRPPGGCGPAPQSHPAFLPAASLPGHTEIRLRLTGDIHAGEISFPSGVLTTKPHDSAGAHRRAWPESLILSVSWDLLRKFVNGRKPPKLPTLLRNLQPLRHLLIYPS